MYTASYPATRAEVAYGELKRLVLLGEFPINVRLGEERLAARLEMSRTPIREALARLHSEGLVVRGPDGGYCPAVPDVVVIQELYEVRATLEVQALWRPLDHDGRHDVGVLESLRDDWRALAADRADSFDEADPTFVLLDESFHTTLAEAAGNRAVVEVLRQVNERIRVVRMQDFLVPERVTATIEEHVGIVDAVLRADIDLAETRLRSHMGDSRGFVQARVLEAIARMTKGHA